MPDPIWFWQRIVSPHMAGLVSAVAAAGRPAVYVAEQEMSADRAAQGWRAPDLGAAELKFASDADAVTALVRAAPANSVHICQGFRGNGLVGGARDQLAKRGLRQWVVMEMVEDRGGPVAWARRLEYRRQIMVWRGRIEGILATGLATPNWLAARGMPAKRILPFAYFLPDAFPLRPEDSSTDRLDGPFRILFVGRLIELKRVDLLIDALAAVTDGPAFELVVVGSGPLADELRARAERRLAGHVQWLGRRAQHEIPALIASADALVLPSRYDGWGAVVSEALMAGVPALCSDACGAAEAVKASGVGGIFRSGDAADLSRLLAREMAGGRRTPEQRTVLATWARCLGAEAGADYLIRILDRASENDAPAPPWRRGGSCA